jgi:p-hydroxybenzoate 3-monooxygenase
VVVLADALEAWYRGGDPTGLDRYSERCLQRVWRVQEFSTGLTSLLHVERDQDFFGRQLQRARQAYLVRSRAMRASLAENYVGLPLDWS